MDLRDCVKAESAHIGSVQSNPGPGQVDHALAYATNCGSTEEVTEGLGKPGSLEREHSAVHDPVEQRCLNYAHSNALTEAARKGQCERVRHVLLRMSQAGSSGRVGQTLVEAAAHNDARTVAVIIEQAYELPEVSVSRCVGCCVAQTVAPCTPTRQANSAAYPRHTIMGNRQGTYCGVPAGKSGYC